MTLVQAQAQLDAWLAASLAIAKGKEHSIGDRRIRFEDGAEVRAQIAFWTRKVNDLSSGSRGSGIVLADFSIE
jgi:hypothetical protein